MKKQSYCSKVLQCSNLEQCWKQEKEQVETNKQTNKTNKQKYHNLRKPRWLAILSHELDAMIHSQATAKTTFCICGMERTYHETLAKCITNTVCIKQNVHQKHFFKHRNWAAYENRSGSGSGQLQKVGQLWPLSCLL